MAEADVCLDVPLCVCINVQHRSEAVTTTNQYCARLVQRGGFDQQVDVFALPRVEVRVEPRGQDRRFERQSAHAGGLQFVDQGHEFVREASDFHRIGRVVAAPRFPHLGWHPVIGSGVGNARRQRQPEHMPACHLRQTLPIEVAGRLLAGGTNAPFPFRERRPQMGQDPIKFRMI